MGGLGFRVLGFRVGRTAGCVQRLDINGEPQHRRQRCSGARAGVMLCVQKQLGTLLLVTSAWRQRYNEYPTSSDQLPIGP